MNRRLALAPARTIAFGTEPGADGINRRRWSTTPPGRAIAQSASPHIPDVRWRAAISTVVEARTARPRTAHLPEWMRAILREQQVRTADDRLAGSRTVPKRQRRCEHRALRLGSYPAAGRGPLTHAAVHDSCAETSRVDARYLWAVIRLMAYGA